MKCFGQSPGPTIEVVEGDRVRIVVTNKLPEHTSIRWHGQRLPNGMDGVTGLNQPGIPPGKTRALLLKAASPCPRGPSRSRTSRFRSANPTATAATTERLLHETPLSKPSG